MTRSSAHWLPYQTQPCTVRCLLKFACVWIVQIGQPKILPSCFVQFISLMSVRNAIHPNCCECTTDQWIDWETGKTAKLYLLLSLLATFCMRLTCQRKFLDKVCYHKVSNCARKCSKKQNDNELYIMDRAENLQEAYCKNIHTSLVLYVNHLFSCPRAIERILLLTTENAHALASVQGDDSRPHWILVLQMHDSRFDSKSEQ